MSEITVILKDSERSYKQKFLIYETYVVSLDDETIKKCIEEAKQNFKDPEDIKIKISMEYV